MLRSRVGSLGELVPVSLVEPDGLIVTTDGRYVRVIECDRVPNTITADAAGLQFLVRFLTNVAPVTQSTANASSFSAPAATAAHAH